jgi:hypothetical protein
MEVNRVIGDKHMFGRAFDFAKTRALYPCLDDDDERKTALDHIRLFRTVRIAGLDTAPPEK